MADRDGCSIRAFQSADQAAIAAILNLTFAAGELGSRTPHDIEHFLERLPATPAGSLVATVGEEVVGFTTPHAQELVVHPAHRRRGYGTRLVEAALGMAQSEGWDKLSLAPPRGSAGAIAFLTRLGFAYDSSLWLLRLPPERQVPAPVFPATVVARPFQPDRDLKGYVALINRAFLDHPSPLAVTEEQVSYVHALPGFDPADILVLTPVAEPDHLIAFCRTEMDHVEGAVTGEVALIGVLPEWRGQGLGRELLRWGVARLRDAGLTEPTLTVEARNERALGLYERAGFERAQEWPRWSKSVAQAT